MVSSRADDEDKVSLIDLGADDYVTKPFSPRELLARVRSAIRHCPREESTGSKSLEFGAVRVDFAAMEASFHGEPVALTAAEFGTLKFLTENAQPVVDRHEILNRTIDNHVLRLRQKFEAEPDNPRHIVTVRGIGYKFVL